MGDRFRISDSNNPVAKHPQNCQCGLVGVEKYCPLGDFCADFLSFALWFCGALNWPGALLFDVIAASMIWRAGEPEVGASYMSQVGPLTLILLLTEVEAALQSPDHYLGGIFSGASFGVATALVELYLLRKISPKFHTWIGIGQVYVAYWFSYIAGVSAVTAAFVSVMTFVWLNQYFKLGFPALLLWPRDVLQQPIQLAVAIGFTVLVIGMSYMGLSYSFPKKSHP